MDNAKREQLKAEMRRRLAEGLNAEERVELKKITEETANKRVGEVARELVYAAGSMKLIGAAKTVEIVPGVAKALAEFGITCRISRDDILKMVTDAWDYMEPIYEAESEKTLEVAMGLLDAEDKFVEKLKAKLGQLAQQDGKNVAADALEGFSKEDLGDKMVTIPKDWDKNVN